MDNAVFNDIDQIDLFFDSIEFDCRRMEDGHLIETFYITKPQLRLEIPEELAQPSESFKKIDDQTNGNVTGDAKQPINSPLTHKMILSRDMHIQRSYRMISKQINCSTAVTLSKTGRCTTRQKLPVKNSYQFMDQFEHLFRSFVPPQRKNQQPPQRRRSSRQKTKAIISRPQNALCLESQSDESGNEDDMMVEFIRSQKRPHLTFYEKMRDKIQKSMIPLLEKNTKRKLHKVQTKPKSKKTVQGILKEKGNLRNSESHLRLSRSGLVIRLDAMQAKTAGDKLRMIENQKPKKDIIFQRCLIKNCEIVLENLEKYQRKKQNPTKRRQLKQHRKYKSNILHTTHYNQHKIHKDSSASMQDLSLLKLREKCLQIQVNCKEDYNKNRLLKQGLRAFGKFCNKVQKRLEAGSGDIQAAFQQNFQREDEAQRLYDAMANIEPIEGYLSSLQ